MPVYVYRLSQWIEKRFNAKGGNVITDIDPAGRLVIPWQVGVEERYLQGWNRFAVVTSQAAVAANFSRIRIRNPGGSNVIVVLEQIAANVGTQDTVLVTWGPVAADLTTLTNVAASRMDPRGNPQPSAIVSAQAGASGGNPNLERNVVSSSTVDFINNPDQEIPILPGQTVDLQAVTANNAMTVTFMWRERALELSELT